MYNNRYYFLKKIYPNYLLLFKSDKNKLGYKCFGNDKYILKYIRSFNSSIDSVTKSLEKWGINYILIDNLQLTKIYKNKENRYCEYMYKFMALDILDRIRAGVLGL